MMKEEIKEVEVQKFNKESTIFSILFFASILLFVPLIKFLGIYGIIIEVVLYVITLIWAFRVEKLKKANNIHTYKEIVAFSEGKRLDEIQIQREIGKRPYQAVLKPFIGAAIGAAVAAVMLWILN